MSHPFIAQRVFNTPVLVDPAKGHAILSGLGGRLVDGRMCLPGVDVPEPRAERAGRIAPRASILGAELADRYHAQDRRMFAVRDGIAIIEVTGTLVHRGAYVGEASGVTSYEGIGAQLAAALSDPQVRGIALEIDTFGGEVAGAFDLADAVRAARAVKPVWAFVAESALSAGYAIASQADRIVLPRTGEVGSIGVLVMHADYSQRLSDEGLAVTMIHAGAHKVDANPFEPLPDDVRADLQAEVGALRDLFLETVAAGRGDRLSAADAGQTQARVYRGAQAVAAGLADEVSDLRTAFTEFRSTVSGRARGPGAPAAAMRGAQQEAGMADKQITTTLAAAPGARPADTDQTAPTETAVAPVPDTTGVPAQEAEPLDTAVPAAAPQASPASMTRDEAAEIAEVAAQAARMGATVDVAEAIRDGTTAAALRARVMEQIASRADADGISAVKPAQTNPQESPVVAAARRAAAAAAHEARQRRH